MSKTHIASSTNEEPDAVESLGKSQTDWEHLRHLSDNEFEASIDLDHEDKALPDLTLPGCTGLPPGVGLSKSQITVRLDRDVIDCFTSPGNGYQTRSNAAL